MVEPPRPLRGQPRIMLGTIIPVSEVMVVRAVVDTRVFVEASSVIANLAQYRWSKARRSRTFHFIWATIGRSIARK